MKRYNLDCFFLICSKKTTILFGVVIAVLLSCKTALYIPNESQQTSIASLSELQAGRKLYVFKCGSCHSLYLPEKYTKQQWQNFLNEMQQKASIDNHEKEQILKYLSKGQ